MWCGDLINHGLMNSPLGKSIALLKKQHDNYQVLMYQTITFQTIVNKKNDHARSDYHKRLATFIDCFHFLLL